MSQFDAAVIKSLNKTLKYLDENLAESLVDTPLMNPPHLLMLFGALAYILIGIPPRGPYAGGDCSAPSEDYQG